jgi:DNA polymerase-3 subunit epsilon
MLLLARHRDPRDGTGQGRNCTRAELAMSRLHIAVVDTETTGLYAASDRIIEVAIKLLAVDVNGLLLEELATYQGLQDPGMRIPLDAIAVHGITDAMVKGHRIDSLRVGELLGHADLIVAHNSGFDKGFVRQVIPHADTLLWGCSCRGIPWKSYYPGLWSTSLPILARYLKLRTGTAHRALGDVETTVNLLLHHGPHGEPHLAHLLRRKLPKARASAS